MSIIFTFSFAVLSFLSTNNQLSSILMLTAALLGMNYFFVPRNAHAFPALALFLHGLKHGLVNIRIFVFILSVIFLVNNDAYLVTSYSSEYKLRLILSFLTVTFLSSLYEYSSTKSFKEMTEKLITVAKQNQLSEFTNNRGVHEEMEALYQHAKEHDEPLSIMLCDIDYLHDINGRYGHDVGDMVIKKVTKEIQNSIKNTHALTRRIKNLNVMHDRNKIQVSLTMGVSDTKSVNSI